MEKINKKILENKGITGVDLTISIIVFTIFSGLIITLMTNIYANSIEIQKSANAMAYATIVLEKVDEKAYEEIDNAFATNLVNTGEVKIDDGYTINFRASYPREDLKDLVKQATVEVSYNIKGKTMSLVINKLKIKEIYNEE